jgi:hypothetical protein
MAQEVSVPQSLVEANAVSNTDNRMLSPLFHFCRVHQLARVEGLPSMAVVIGIESERVSEFLKEVNKIWLPK